MKYLISVCAALIVAFSGASLANTGDKPGWLSAEEAYFSGTGFSSQVESYAQGNVPSARGSSNGYRSFDEPNGHDYSIEEYLFFTGSGFMS